MTASVPEEPRSRRQRAGALADKLPTKWLITGITTVLLALSALFGGLDDVPVPVIPVVEAGTEHAGLELSVTVGQALLIDGFPEQNITPDEGNRLLVVRATVENTTSGPLRLSTAQVHSLSLAGVPSLPSVAPPSDIVVIDDGSDKVVVQPRVPVELAYIWEVEADAVAAGDVVTVDLFDRVFLSEGRLTYGGLYDDPVVSATVELALDDVGAGVNQ
ncbi:MAG: hypothetical protein ABWY68_10385 [Cryobacterium sp.]